MPLTGQQRCQMIVTSNAADSTSVVAVLHDVACQAWQAALVSHVGCSGFKGVFDGSLVFEYADTFSAGSTCEAFQESCKEGMLAPAAS